MKKHYAISALGSAILDMSLTFPDEGLAKIGLEKGSMILITSEEADRLLQNQKIHHHAAGGSAANSCVALTQSGGSACFMSRTGSDEAGDIFAHQLEALGVHFKRALGKTPTGRCIILIGEDGERSMCASLGASANMDKTLLDRQAIEQSQFFYSEGYVLDNEKGAEMIEQAAIWAKEAGGAFALSLSDRFCVERHKESFTTLVKKADWIFGNALEFAALLQETEIDKARNALARLAKTHTTHFALTRSEKGAVIITPETQTEIAPHPIKTLIDSTGAGDAFAGTFLYHLSENTSIEQAGANAAKQASSVLGHYGAHTLSKSP